MPFIKNNVQFKINGINYHFFKCDSNFLLNTIDHIFHLKEKNDYSKNRALIKNISDQIDPDLIVICGAENPYYSLFALDIIDKPLLIQLQTFLNSPQRISNHVGSPYRIEKEIEVMQKANYIACPELEYVKEIHDINPVAKLLKIKFPVKEPQIANVEIDSDFVFYANRITAYKGIEDAITAFLRILKTNNRLTFKVIGSCDSQYLLKLKSLIPNQFKSNIFFIDSFPNINDLFSEVQKSRVALLPGKTGALNSTVRECMFMKVLVVLYHVDLVDQINSASKCLIDAEMNNIDDLFDKIYYCISKPDVLQKITANAFDYAKKNFGNEKINELINIEFHDIINNFYNKTKIPTL